MSPPSPPESAPAADGPDWVGRIVGGRYRVEAVLGQGGMGTAYEAFDQKLGRTVVLKVPHTRHFQAQEARGRFQDEVRQLIAIEQPFVVRVYDQGEEEGTPYAVFQFLAGGSLGARLRVLGSRVAPVEVVPWLTQVAEALDDLHARGGIHRDVKPDNILFDRPLAPGPASPDKGRANAYLADFGLAKALGVDPSRIFQSQTGTLIGTQAYMAPEQFDARSQVTGAVDQYALATTVYQALSGQLPFAVSSAEELVFEKATRPPRPLSEVAGQVPMAVARAVMRALSSDPRARFASCAEFARAVAVGAQAGVGDVAVTKRAPPAAMDAALAAEAAGGAGGPARPPRPRPRWIWVAAVSTIVGGLGGAGLLLGWFRGVAPVSRNESAAGGPAPAPVPPAMDSSPLPAAPTPAMAEPPPLPPPAWKPHIEAAKSAGHGGDWVLAGRELDAAFSKDLPRAELPAWLEDGVRNWKAEAAIVITDPADPTTVTTETVDVQWVLSTPRPKDAVTVTSNGKTAVGAVAGHATVSLVEGENRIELVARDEKGGERARGSVLVVREKKLSGAPEWAKVSEEQIAEAKRLGIPVAFENSVGMRFVLVPAGTFTMGSPEAEKGRFPEETPHDVTLTKPYYVAIHETTNGAYRRFKPEHASGEEQGTSLDGDTQPVVEVSHTEAVAFAAWLSVQDPGREYRLPTEAEWEYAARAGTTTSRYWGDDEEGFVRHANIVDLGEAADASVPTAPGARRPQGRDGFVVTAPVGSFLPNAWGLYDVIGNVCEMCSDWTGEYPTGPATDPQGPPSGTHRVARGGSWAAASNLAFTFAMVGPRVSRSAFRSAVDPEESSSFDGFRLVASVRGSLPDAIPGWAKVAPDQIAEAKRLAIPVAFENGIGMRFVLVPAGTFLMGSPTGEKGHQPDETQHRVTLTQAYYVSLYETTNAQYRRFERAHDSGNYEDKGQEEPLNGDSQPAVRVSHAEAAAFSTWLSGQESGRTYRLPTEAEWENAARAKTTTSRYWGDDERGFARNANIADAAAKAKFAFSWSGAWDDGFAATAPVGTYSPNGWGLYDMYGNVWEWCADWYGKDDPSGEVTDPTGPVSGTGRVLRGGSWNHWPDNTRAASRGGLGPGERGSNGGFRLVAPARASR